MISPESIQTLRETVRLSDLMREDCELKRSGSRWVCCCPIHAERTPSCFVNDESNTFHCFGCGASGDAISYVMKVKGLPFSEALEYLAAKFGVELVRVRRDGGVVAPRDDRGKGDLLRALAEAQRYFRWNLERAPDAVRDYIKTRGISAEAVEAFGVGFAPLRSEGLLTVLRKKEITDEVAIAAGLMKRDQSGQLRPAFRGRLLFPIVSERNQIIGFGGRIIPSLFSDGRERPKYLNSLESPVYQKHKTLYGLPLATRAIRERGEVYVVEGYLDVIGLWQVGVRHVVACCGTALTAQHGERLARLARRITLLFDGDDAGRAAAARSFKTVVDLPVDVWSSFLPEGEDPDDVAKRLGMGTDTYLAGLSRRSLLSAFIDEQIRRHGGEEAIGPFGRASIGEEVNGVLAQVSRDVVRYELIREAASRLRTDAALLGSVGGGVALPRVAEARPAVTTTEKGEGSADDAGQRLYLSAVEQQLLMAVMGRWESLPAVVLADPEVCGALGPSVLEFITALRDIAAGVVAEHERVARVKDLLRARGKEWIALWRRAREMVSAPGVELDKWYDDVVMSCRRHRLTLVSRELEREIERSITEEERTALMGKKLVIRRQLEQLALPRSSKEL